jgi:hypothetical protein
MRSREIATCTAVTFEDQWLIAAIFSMMMWHGPVFPTFPQNWGHDLLGLHSKNVRKFHQICDILMNFTFLDLNNDIFSRSKLRSLQEQMDNDPVGENLTNSR